MKPRGWARSHFGASHCPLQPYPCLPVSGHALLQACVCGLQVAELRRAQRRPAGPQELTLQVQDVQLSTTQVSFSAKNRPSCQQAVMFLVLGGPPRSSSRNWLSFDCKGAQHQEWTRTQHHLEPSEQLQAQAAGTHSAEPECADGKPRSPSHRPPQHPGLPTPSLSETQLTSLNTWVGHAAGAGQWAGVRGGAGGAAAGCSPESLIPAPPPGRTATVRRRERGHGDYRPPAS